MSHNSIMQSHPGMFLKKYLMESGKVLTNALAQSLHLSEKELQDLLCGKKNIDAALAICLGECFDTSAEFWMYQQVRFDLLSARSSQDGAVKEKKVLRLTA